MKKVIAIVLTIIALVSCIFCINAGATSAVPYSEKNVSISFFRTSATAYIKKCTCTPVNNHLEVWIRVQYKTGNGYGWIPSQTTYYFDKGDNVSESRKTIEVSNINFAEGMHYARCGGGSLKTYPFAISG